MGSDRRSAVVRGIVVGADGDVPAGAIVIDARIPEPDR
jgi:hypothetical protein